MPYTLKSNAINAAAKIFFVGDNGLTNLVGGGAITNTGTVTTSTIDGHTAYGFANNTAGQYLSATIADGIPANTKYTVLMVGRFGVTAANDVKIAVPPTAGFAFGAGQAIPKAVVITPYLGGAAGSVLPSYAFPNTIGYMLIEGRDTNGAIRTYANDTLATPWAGDSGSRGETIAAGEWKFLARPEAGQGGFGGSIVALFIGVGPQEVYDYIVANAGSATGIERVYSALLDAGSSDGSASGSIASASLTAPNGSATGTSPNGSASGSFGAVTLTAPNGTATGSTLNGSASGAVSAVSLTAATGSASGTTSGAGTITLGPLKNNTGTVLASLTGITVHVYQTSGALVVTKTGQTTNGSGTLVVSDAAIAAATQYRCVIVLGTGAEGMDKATAA